MGTRVPEYICKQPKEPPITTVFLSREIAYQWRLQHPLPNPDIAPLERIRQEIENSKGYGFMVNIHHPSVYPIYQEFRRFKNAGIFPIDDKDREIFEADLILNVFRSEFRNFYNSTVLERIQTRICENPENLKNYEKWVKHRREFFRQLKAG